MVSERRFVHVTVILTVLAMLFTAAVPGTADEVAAADPADPVVLTVYEEDGNTNTTKEAFTMAELKALAADEGDKTYSYSTYNSYPTFEKLGGISGVTVEKILATSGIDVSAIDDKQPVEFVGSDKRPVSVTANQLFDDERYYYPNGGTGTEDGKRGNAGNLAGAAKVPAIISTAGAKGPISTAGDNTGRLFFGQKAPNEQTKEAWNKFVATWNEATATGGKIIVKEGVADTVAAAAITPAVGTVTWGTPIQISHNDLKDVKIHYTLDGSTPAINCDVYNYATSGRQRTAPITAPAGVAAFTVKAYVMKYGSLDSVPVTRTYNVVPPTITGVRVSPLNYNTTKISWDSAAGVDGYKVYYSTSRNGTYTGLATGANSYTHSKLKTGRTYYYKVAPYKGTAEGAASVIVSAKPTLKKPTSLKVRKRGKKRALITVKKVAGATGYVVYRSTKKKRGFKKIKTIKRSTLRFTNKKLKSGRRYYYKVRAYRTVNGKKVYSPYTKVVSVRAR